MNITFEPIKEQDIEILTLIMKAAFDDDTRMHTDLQEDGPIGYDDGSLIRSLLTLEDSTSEKICVNNQTAGAYTVHFSGNEGILEMLYINPALKSRGIGKAVWNHIENKYNNVSRWFLETPDYSIRNQKFYGKCGFKLINIDKENETYQFQKFV